MTSASDNFRAEAATRILVKDGAYGTMIQAEKLVEADYRGDLAFTLDQRGNNDLLNLTRPATIEAICQRFVDAGADILATNTFNATSISQSDYGPEAVALADEMNRAEPVTLVRSPMLTKRAPAPPPPSVTRRGPLVRARRGLSSDTAPGPHAAAGWRRKQRWRRCARGWFRSSRRPH